MLSWLVNPFAERTTWLYDALGRVTTMTHGNLSAAEHDYDAGGRLTALRNLKSDRSVISIFTYSYDSIGNRLGVAEASGDLVTWSYDETYQLTREQRSGDNAYDTTFTYDGVGNRLTQVASGATTTYAYDAANELLTSEDASGLTTFTYDANGNTATKLEPAGDRTTYSYDIENMLTQVALPDATNSTFVYDGDRRLRSKTEASATTNFIRDLERVLLEADGNWATLARYTIPGGGWFDPLVAMRRSGASAFYHFDALGSANKLTDADAATLAEYLYRAFGADTVLSGTITNPYRFVAAFGYYRTAASLLHLGARYYLPEVGRFVSRDPIEFARVEYRYVNANPATYVDPNGLLEEWCEEDGEETREECRRRAQSKAAKCILKCLAKGIPPGLICVYLCTKIPNPIVMAGCLVIVCGLSTSSIVVKCADDCVKQYRREVAACEGNE